MLLPLLGVEQGFSLPTILEGIGNVNNFLKMNIWKHVSSELAWDKVTHIVYEVYNFVLNEHHKESAFFLMFEKDVYTPLVQLHNPELKIYGK